MIYGVRSPYNQGDTPFMQKNIWHSVVYTYDGSVASFYVDCKLVSKFTDPGRNFSTIDDLFLGRFNNAQYPY